MCVIYASEKGDDALDQVQTKSEAGLGQKIFSRRIKHMWGPGQSQPNKMWSRAIFFYENNKNSGVLGQMEVQGNISQSDCLFNHKNEIKAKINAFSFRLIFFSKSYTSMVFDINR